MEDNCEFDRLCKEAVRRLTTAKTFAALEAEALLADQCAKCWRHLQEADRYVDVDLTTLQDFFRMVRDAAQAKDWQGVKDNLAVVIELIEARAATHRETCENPTRSLQKLQVILDLARWNPPANSLPN